jgi:putative pyruvate formate lyase activating enzyme
MFRMHGATMICERQRPQREELLQRARLAQDSLSACTLCEHRCGANRAINRHTPCGLGTVSSSFTRHVSFSEELELLPSYMVYLSGCNFRCRFCVQGPTCFAPAAGQPVDARALAAEFTSVVARGAKTINLLGGEPSIHLPAILQIAAELEHPLPLVLNSNMYMTEQTLQLLEGVIAIYLADFKFGNDDCALRIADAPRYFEIVSRNLLLAAGQSRVIIRHLLMPGHLECCLKPVARWVAANLPETPFTLMTSYLPAWRSGRDRHGLDRCTTEEEASEARRIVASLGLHLSA